MDAADIRSLAVLFRQHGANERLFPEGETQQRYAQLLRRMVGVDVPGKLRGVEFRPCFLLNGLAFAAQHPPDRARHVVRALARGLEAFAPLFAREKDGYLLEPGYGAFVLAQFTDCGIPLATAFATLKADSLDMATSYAWRDLLEGGPEALLSSPLFEFAERALWEAYLATGEAAWPPLRAHLAVRAEAGLEPPWPAP